MFIWLESYRPFRLANRKGSASPAMHLHPTVVLTGKPHSASRSPNDKLAAEFEQARWGDKPGTDVAERIEVATSWGEKRI